MLKLGNNQNSSGLMWRGAALPALSACLAALILATAIWHRPGILGGLLGSVTVLIFFSVHLGIDRLAKNLDPMATMALAMFSYFAKVFLMGAFLIVISRTTAPSTINRPAFAITALAATAAWLGGEIRAFLKLRLTLDVQSSSAAGLKSPPATDVTE